MRQLILSIILLGFATAIMAQAKKDYDVVQVSGIVMTSDSLYPVSYANIAIKGTNRGTYANFEGFFSIVARKGETLQFSAINYEPKEFTIPEDHIGDRLTLVQLLTDDAYNLPETVVFPWPSREHLKLEFLALNVKKDLEDRAQENLDNSPHSAKRWQWTATKTAISISANKLNLTITTADKPHIKASSTPLHGQNLSGLGKTEILNERRRSE